MKKQHVEKLKKGDVIRGHHGQRGDVIGVEAPGNEICPTRWIAWVNLVCGSTRIWGDESGAMVELFGASQEAS